MSGKKLKCSTGPPTSGIGTEARLLAALGVHGWLVFGLAYTIVGSKDDSTFIRISQAFGTFFCCIIVMANWISIVKRHHPKLWHNITLFTTTAVIGAILNRIYFQELYFLNLIYPMLYAGTAIALYVGVIGPRTMAVYFWGVTGVLLYRLIIGVPPMELVQGSENQISVIGIALMAMYVVSYRGKVTGSLLSAGVMLFVLCGLANGRSGVITSGLFLIGLGILGIRSPKIKISFCVLIGALVSLYVVPRAEGLLETYAPDFLVYGIRDRSGRELIFSWYLEKLTIETAICGIRPTELMLLYSLSLHSSYLEWHSLYGLPGVFLFGVAMMRLVRMVLRQPIAGLVCSMLMLRGSTDTILYSSHIVFGAAFLYSLSGFESQSAQGEKGQTV